MKLHIQIVLIFLILFLAAGAAQGFMPVFVDETLVELETSVGRIAGNFFAPITLLRDHVGAEVTWTPGSANANIVFDDAWISFEAGNESALVNDKYLPLLPLDSPAYLDEGILMVPLRFVTTHLGMKMEYDAGLGGLNLIRTEEQRRIASERVLLEQSTEPDEERSSILAQRPSLEVVRQPDQGETTVKDDSPSELDPPEPLQRRIISMGARPQPKFEIAPYDPEGAIADGTLELDPGNGTTDESVGPSDWIRIMDRQGMLRYRQDEVPGEADKRDWGRQDLRAIHYVGGPRSSVRIEVDNFHRYQSVLLMDPDRLVVDIHGLEGEGLPDQILSGSLIERIRSSRFDENTIRIVFDLHTSTGYEVRHWPDGGLEVEFNYHISDVYLERDGLDNQPRLHINASADPDFTVIQLVEPRRTVLDFHTATLTTGPQEILVEDGHIERIRVSQFIPSTTRIVLDLRDEVSPLALTAGNGEFILNLFEGSQTEARIYQARLSREQSIAIGGDPDGDYAEIHVPDQAPRSVRREGAALAGFIIAVDPGHGGSDPGAIGPLGTFEKDVVLDIGLYVGALLEDAGAKVVYTRRTDKYVSIFERPQIAAQSDADMLVSIHVNSYLGNSARGTETLYHPKDIRNQQLAQTLQNELVRAIDLVDRGLRQRTDLAVLNHSHIPSALVEVGFLNHREEELLLRSSGFQQVAAEGIFNGIVRYLERAFPH